jgi:DNA-binding MarR family transcriptional regulator
MERNITLFEEAVLRAVHHEFGALTQGEAAEQLGVSESKISRTLDDLRFRSRKIRAIRVMFPILTQHQFSVFKCISNQGMSIRETADEMKMSVSAVKDVLGKIKAKGQVLPRPIQYSHYTPAMDSVVSETY